MGKTVRAEPDTDNGCAADEPSEIGSPSQVLLVEPGVGNTTGNGER